MKKQEFLQYLSIYEIDEKQLKNLKIKKFEKAGLEWLLYVTHNRTKDYQIEKDYNIVIGPVANDNTAPVLNLYISGLINEETAIDNLKTYVLRDQYTFKTEEALSYLKFIGSETYE